LGGEGKSAIARREIHIPAKGRARRQGSLSRSGQALAAAIDAPSMPGLDHASRSWRRRRLERHHQIVKRALQIDPPFGSSPDY
jgi:hypothetical protein